MQIDLTHMMQVIVKQNSILNKLTVEVSQEIKRVIPIERKLSHFP